MNATKSSPSAETIRKGILTAEAILRRSERGRDVIHDLHHFLQGRIAGLDGAGWDAVHVLMVSYQHGYAGSVLEALEPICKEEEVHHV